MKVFVKQLVGLWDMGFALDKHMASSTYLGDDEYGHPRFNNVRTEVGEATFQLKYRNDWNQVEPLAQALAEHIYPKLSAVGFIVPMPVSKTRARQSVAEVAIALGARVEKPVFTDLLHKSTGGQPLKDLNTKEEKLAAIGDSFSINDQIGNDGAWNVLLVDDLYHTGASMEMACRALRAYRKVKKVYVATLT